MLRRSLFRLRRAKSGFFGFAGEKIVDSSPLLTHAASVVGATFWRACYEN